MLLNSYSHIGGLMNRFVFTHRNNLFSSPQHPKLDTNSCSLIYSPAESFAVLGRGLKIGLGPFLISVLG